MKSFSKSIVPLVRAGVNFVAHPFVLENPLLCVRRLIVHKINMLLGRTVIYSWVNDSKFIAMPCEYGINGNAYLGLIDYEVMSFMIGYLGTSHLFVDVGANVGSYSILAAKVCGAKVLAFEPDDSVRARFHDNVRLNEIQSSVKISGSCVSDSVGIRHFSTGLNCENKVTTEASSDATKKRSVRLVDVVPESDKIALKIDVEGHERQVLNGSEELLASGKVEVVIIETIWDSDYLDKYLSTFGFQKIRFSVSDRSVRVVKERAGKYNEIYVRDPCIVQRALDEKKGRTFKLFEDHGLL